MGKAIVKIVYGIIWWSLPTEETAELLSYIWYLTT